MAAPALPARLASHAGRHEENRRYHSLDQLRAAMMLLGLVLHSSLAFVTVPLANWPFKDASTSVLLDILGFFIHVFRMPLFFLMAGFFAAYLYYRRGWWRMFTNRMARVGLPFVVFLPIMFPLNRSGFLFSVGGGIGAGEPAAISFFSNPSLWYEGFQTAHLWFLYYLVFYYAAIAVSMPLIERFTGSWSVSIGPKLGWLIHHPLGLLIGISTTLMTLLPMEMAGLDTENGFLVQPKILFAYGVFVAFGWVLYLNRDQVDRFGARAWPYIGVGFLLSCGYLAYSISLHGQFLLAGKALAAAAMWTLIYGFIGLFVRYYDHPRPLGRYLADASYWLYLLHLPLTIWLPGLLIGWNAHAIVKFSLTLAGTAFICLATYELFVRSTFIGKLLNGKRYRRGLPKLHEHSPATPLGGGVGAWRDVSQVPLVSEAADRHG